MLKKKILKLDALYSPENYIFFSLLIYIIKIKPFRAVDQFHITITISIPRGIVVESFCCQFKYEEIGLP